MKLIESIRSTAEAVPSKSKPKSFSRAYRNAVLRSRLWVAGSFVLFVGAAPASVIAALDTNRPEFLLGIFPSLMGTLFCAARSSLVTEKVLARIYRPLGINRVRTFPGTDFEPGKELDSFNYSFPDGRKGVVTVIAMGKDLDPQISFSELQTSSIILDPGAQPMKELTP